MKYYGININSGYQGAGYYDKYTGYLIELDNDCKRECEQGEIWEGSYEDYFNTFKS